MKVVEQNRGRKTPYSLSGSVLTLGKSADIEIDLEERQRDVETMVDIYVAPNGELTRENSPESQYAAVIRIPPRNYASEQVEEELADGSTFTTERDVPQPVDTDACTLMLWALPTEPTNEEETA